MTVRRKKLGLIVASLALFALAASVLVWGLAPPHLPSESRDSVVNSPHAGGGRPGADAARQVVAGDFQEYWDRPLRRPLYDPPPPKPKPVEKKSPPPLRAKLLATMVEPGRSTAMLRLASGEVVFRAAGEVIGADDNEATIAEIKPGTVVVRRGEQDMRLSIDGSGGN